MKKVYAFLLLSFCLSSGFGQATKTSTIGKADALAASLSLDSGPKIYAELIAEFVMSREKMTIQFDQAMSRYCKNKTALSAIQSAGKMEWQSVNEFLTIMSTNGWNLEFVYTSPGAAGVRRHYLISAPSQVTTALKPWLR